MLMEQLFRLTELELRVPLNLNVLDPAGVPRVMNLKEALREFLDHRRVVLQRRSRHRLAAVARRMEVLRGLVIVYVNLDEVIRIIREEDEPKAEMMVRWGLTDMQAEAILNMRLRALRRLEEVAIRKELEELAAEAAEIERLLGSDRRQWTVLAKEVTATAKEFGGDTVLGRRRTTIGEAPEPFDLPAAALIERESVTVLCSEKDWIRTVKGHKVPAAEPRYKEGDGPRFAVAAETTDRLMIFGSNGRFYTLGADRLPGGRGQGEPLRLMIDLANEFEIVAMFPYRLGMKLLVAASDGRGFIVDGEEALAQTRAGKQVLSPGKEASRLRLRSGRWRRRRVCRREPAHAGGRSCRDPRNRARPRRHPAALPDGQADRRQGVPPRRRAVLAPRREPHPHRDRSHALARRPRRRRPRRAAGFPALRQVRMTRLVFLAAIVFALAAADTASAALAPNYERLRELAAILGDQDLVQKLGIQPIVGIEATGKSDYTVRTEKCTVAVTLVAAPNAPAIPGPWQFTIQVGEPQCR